MSDPTPSFYTEIGTGWYLDSNGVITYAKPNRPAAGVGVADVPINKQTLDRILKVIETAIGGAKSVLPKDENDKYWKDTLKASEDLIKVLAASSKALSMLSWVGAVISFLESIGELLGYFGAPDSGANQAIKALMTQAQDIEEADQSQQRRERIADLIGSLERGAVPAKRLVDHLRGGAVDDQFIASLREELADGIQDSTDKLAAFLDIGTWTWSFMPEEYTVYKQLNSRLQFFPKGPDQGMSQPFRATASERFDHRYQLPVVAYSVTTYITYLRAYLPEFRSIGAFADYLRERARALDVILLNVRTSGLGRIVTPRETFDFAHLSVQKPPFTSSPPRSPSCAFC